MPMEDRVVNSPPNGRKHAEFVSFLSPMKCPFWSSSPHDRLGMNPKTQRKLYDEQMLVVASIEVWGFHSFDLAMQLIFEECPSIDVD